jgi:hypothetical protein
LSPARSTVIDSLRGAFDARADRHGAPGHEALTYAYGSDGLRDSQWLERFWKALERIAHPAAAFINDTVGNRMAWNADCDASIAEPTRRSP